MPKMSKVMKHLCTAHCITDWRRKWERKNPEENLASCAEVEESGED